MYKSVRTFYRETHRVRRTMQNPNEDTEWNDVLRAKGIIPEKPKEAEVTEEQLLAMVEQTIKEKSGSKSNLFSVDGNHC